MGQMLVRLNGRSVTMKEIKKAMDEADTNNSGTLEQHEFVVWYSSGLKQAGLYPYCALKPSQITPGGGMKRRDKETRKQPSGDPSTGENPGATTRFQDFHQYWDLR